MTKRRKSNVTIVPPPKTMPSPAATTRRRSQIPQSPTNGVPPGTKEINAGSVLENSRSSIEYGGKMTVSRAIAITGVMVHGAMPAILSWALTMGFIFGGCCSNVFALEAIVKEEPDSGLLITFVQFVLTALFTFPSHFSASRPPSFLKRRNVPIMRWIPGMALFFTVNMMNNFAFGYNISVPVHIILRSGGSVTTMLVGFIWGKRYGQRQIIGVVLLTIGVIVAAMADARAKGKIDSKSSGESDSLASFMTGLLILFVAQVLSAIMGIYVQNTYQAYGPHWNENLFYSHVLSLPLFIPFLPSLYRQFLRLADSRLFTISFNISETLACFLGRSGPPDITKSHTAVSFSMPIQVIMLAANSLTQYACIKGVNLLGARTTALGVTVVLNLRKLVSLFASIWLFGNELPRGVLLGAGVVFLGAGVYASETGSKKKATSKPKAKAT